MLRIKSILCYVICILLFSTLTAQLSLKNEPLNNVVNENFYTGKQWNVEQILKDSLSVKSIAYDHVGSMLTISRISMIYLSITELPAAPVHSSVSDKLQSHLKTSRFDDGDPYFPTVFRSCWSLYPRKYERPIVGKFFFNHQ